MTWIQYDLGYTLARKELLVKDVLFGVNSRFGCVRTVVPLYDAWTCKSKIRSAAKNALKRGIHAAVYQDWGMYLDAVSKLTHFLNGMTDKLRFE